ncbi:cyclin N-terminal domain-containing protein 1 [Ixodes scapularis]|uniref:cyclin N-terminal domain-containing protein 1 n=1 Tax=Ixodes scapularis TaxID=6945 RepID=UPI001A9ECCC6|nr:cyclin N-terminal domain-containing protein 1 [Ixodes scapularis]
MANGLEEEGLFARDMPTVAPDLLTDILCVLAQQNDDAVRNPEDFLDHLAPTDTVELVFRSCSHLNLPLFVQFMAVEYLDRFLVKHVRDLRSQLGLPGSSVSWDSVMTRLKDQVLLRVLSCVQIASKKFYSSRVVSINAVRRFLRSASQSYSAASVLQSEKRVLSTLQFRVEFPTPLVYLEVLLDVIGHNDPSFEGEEVYPAAVRVLQGFYLMRIQVYDMALRDLLPDGAACDDRRRRMVRAFKADQLLLASAIILSAVQLTFPCKYKRVLGHMHLVTRLAKRELQSLSSILMAVLSSEAGPATE